MYHLVFSNCKRNHVLLINAPYECVIRFLVKMPMLMFLTVACSIVVFVKTLNEIPLNFLLHYSERNTS